MLFQDRHSMQRSTKPRFKSFIFYQNSPKIVIFAKKCKIFERWGISPQTLVPPAPEGFAPRPPPGPHWPPAAGGEAPHPQNSPPLPISGYTPGLEGCVFDFTSAYSDLLKFYV